MAGLNELICSDSFGNTGTPGCPLIPANFTGMIIVPKSFEIKETDVNDLQTFLKTAANNSDKKERIYPIGDFGGLEDNSDDDSTEELGYGYTITLGEGLYKWTFRLRYGSICQQASLRKWNGKQVYALFYDANGVLFGQKDVDVLKGIPIGFKANKFSLSDGDSAATAFSISVEVQPHYLIEDSSFIDTRSQGFMIEEIKGLVNVMFKVISGGGTDTVVVKATGCSSDILNTYETELSDESLWVATKVSDGTANVIASVVISDGFATISLTSAADSKINLTSVSSLVNAGIEGYEGIAFISKS